MKSLIVIPSRMASTRLPAKPLKLIGGKTLIERVHAQAVQVAGVDKVILATDSPEIIDEGVRINAITMMTSSTLLTGSDRVAAVVESLELKGESFDLIANVQGDMPFITPSIIEQAFKVLAESALTVGMVTVVTPITDEEEFFRPSVVKAVLGQDNQALYFSRAPIPYPRNKPKDSESFGFKHIGLYVFRPATLKAMATMLPVLCEEREGLEQLRLLANGVNIKTVIIDRAELEPSVEVDTPEDLQRANQIAESGNFS